MGQSDDEWMFIQVMQENESRTGLDTRGRVVSLKRRIQHAECLAEDYACQPGMMRKYLARAIRLRAFKIRKDHCGI